MGIWVVFNFDVNSGSLGFFEDSSLDSLSFGERYESTLSFSDNKNVWRSSCKCVSYGILEMDDGEASWVSFLLGDNTNTTQITSGCDHSNISNFEFNEINNLSSGEIKFNGILGANQRVGESDSSRVVEVSNWNSVGSSGSLSDSAKLELSFFRGDSVDGESSLGVVQESEGFVSGWDVDDIHESSWEGWVGSDLSVDLDVSLHDDELGFSSSQSVFESVSQ